MMIWIVRNISVIISTWGLLNVSFVYAVESTQDTSKSYYLQEKQQIPIIITPDQLKWNKIDLFPGAYCAVASGDPTKEGQYIVRLKFPSNYKIFPNWQTATVNVTVLSGSLHIGVGDKFDTQNGKTLSAGSSVIIPAKSHLYSWTTEDSVLQIHGLGPWNMQFVNPSQDSRNSLKTRHKSAIH